jgi:hypothetical protein
MPVTKIIWKVSYCSHLLNQSGAKNSIIIYSYGVLFKLVLNPGYEPVCQSVLFNDHYFHCIYHQSVPEYPDKIQAIIKPGKINMTVITV